MMNGSVDIRSRIVETFRRDLIGPLPESVEPNDADLQQERLLSLPSRSAMSFCFSPASSRETMNAAISAAERSSRWIFSIIWS